MKMMHLIITTQEEIDIALSEWISARVSKVKLVLGREIKLFRAAAERSGLSSAYNPRQYEL